MPRSCVSPKSISRIRPPSSRITLPALISRWRNPAACTAPTARQTSMPTSAASRGTQRTLGREQVRERLALHEVAPEPDPPFVAVHAVDRHDVGMSHSRDRSRFAKQRAGFVVSIETAGQEQLQRDVALERRVERAVDLAERASPHALQPLERPPAVQRLWSPGSRQTLWFRARIRSWAGSHVPIMARAVEASARLHSRPVRHHARANAAGVDVHSQLITRTPGLTQFQNVRSLSLKVVASSGLLSWPRTRLAT